MSTPSDTKSDTKTDGASSDASCCPPGSIAPLPGALPPADYKLQGAEETYEGTKLYVAGKDHKHGKAVIVIPDIVGWSGRIKQIVDEFALAGYLAVVPDFFGDDGWKGGLDFSGLPAWVKRHGWDTVQPVLEHATSYVTKAGATKIGLLGFCWGNWVVLKGSATSKYAAGVSYHPSQTGVCKLTGEDETALVEAVKVPQLYCPCSNDPETVKKDGLTDKTFKKNGIEFVIHEFPEQQHGFVSRGDVSKPEVVRDVRIALDLGKEFFKKHL